MSTDTREALAALMVIAAECAQRKPLRGFEELTEATHIGHRQFGRAHEKADEDVRMLAVRLRAVFDTLAAALATQPAQPAQLEAMVDKAWSRFEAEDQRLKSKKSERVRALVNAGSFPGMSEAFDAHMGAECWTDPAYQPDASTWAAAWKAAKRDSAAQPSAQGEAVAWKLVPVEPTADMRNAYHAVTDDDVTMKGAAGSRWAAMLASAPAAPAQAVPLTDEHVNAVVRSVQPYLSTDCKAWRELTETCRYWLQAERGIKAAPCPSPPPERDDD